MTYISNTKRPTLSVGLAVYNGERYLDEAIRSLLSQDVSDLELIISDNASTDSTPDICARYASTDQRVRFRRNSENMGAAANFNQVFERSCGEYFMWGSADDIWSHDFAGKCISTLEGTPSAVMCSTGVTVIDEHGSVRGDVEYSNMDTVDLRPAERISRLVSRSVWYDIYSVIRPDALRKTRLYRPVYGGDVLLLLELALLGEFAVIPERLFRYRLPNLPKTTEQHEREIVGSGDTRVKGRPWTTMARQSLETVEESSLDTVESSEVREAMIGALSQRRCSWGRAILAENGISPHLPLPERVRRNLVLRAIHNE